MARALAVIADDLTGANDAAIQFVAKGKRTIVVPAFNEGLVCSFIGEYDVVSINTDTRAMDAGKAMEKVGLVCRDIPGCSVYKKIDSILRGNTAHEIESVMRSLGFRASFIIPSYPANSRTVENRMLNAGGISFDAVEHLEAEIGRKIGYIPLSMIREDAESILPFAEKSIELGEDIFLCDAVSLQDIETLVEHLNKPGFMLAGSAGCASVLAGIGESRFKLEPRKVGGERVLTVLGSVVPLMRRQFRTLRESLDPDVAFLDVGLFSRSPEEAVSRALSSLLECKGRNAVLCLSTIVDDSFDISEHRSEEDRKLSKALVDALSSIAESFISSMGVSSIIASGGDTASALVSRFGAKGLEPLEEILPGIPLLSMVGSSHDDIPIVTKSGSFGSDDALVIITRYLMDL
ncbi:MAG: four-carbon acid sugar kinase family protein [Candidatus Ornithospirochaeta sp.]|nr:four-carbon acid sugar kinase family protein [Candidatus Ornithospirochaeta sp.]